MNVPLASERKSLLPLRLRPVSNTQPPMPAVPEPATTTTTTNNLKTPILTVGNRVLVNGLKSGTLRYLGTVQFAPGEFCGVELDQPEGKHDGEVQKIRYFLCAPNHGIFVPKDKVVPEPRQRTASAQRPMVSRLKPPSITRSMTLNAPITKHETPKVVQLPDIVPSSVPSSPVTMNTPGPELSTKNEDVIQTSEPPKGMIFHQAEPTPAPVILDEPSETIEADFTASVSLILHQLQQDQQQKQQQEQISTRNSSITISEEETEDDDVDDEDDDDEEDDQEESEHESVVQAIREEVVIPIIDRSKSIQTDLSFQVHDNIAFTKIEANSTKTKPNVKDNADSKTPNPPGKKNIERRPIASPAKPTTLRKPLATPVKKPVSSKPQLNPAQSVASLPSQSRLHSTRSSLNSLNSSQSDLNSTVKMSESQLSPIHDLEKQLELSEQNLTALQNQFQTEKHLHQSLQLNYRQLIEQYCHLRNRFDLMQILTEYLIDQNDQHQHQHIKARHKYQRVTKHIHELQSTHQTELNRLMTYHQHQLNAIHQSHQDHIKDLQLKIRSIEDEKRQVESRCQSLQEKVDGFLTEMANSEHADVLLCHVEHLEKDRTSLQTVLEMKTLEVNQLRTKLNEQIVQLEEKMALQKRIDMAENRNQDLSYLLRQRQLQEKAAIIERDQLKEKYLQLEREHRQLKFENETLLYRLRQRSISPPPPLPPLMIESPPALVPSRSRSRSFSSTGVSEQSTERLHRSLSLNAIFLR